MKTYLVSFTTTYEDIGFQDVELRQFRLIESAKKFGINHFFTWNRQKFLKTSFYKQNKEILDQKIGAGYWLWKPYIILDALEKVNEGDFVFYIDNSFFIINDITNLLNVCQNNYGFHLSEHNKVNTIKTICQKETFKIMNLSFEEYSGHPLIIAGYQLYQKNERTLNFVKEYLHYCTIPNAIMDISNKEKEDIAFKGHKHDMSILSLLAAKYKINPKPIFTLYFKEYYKTSIDKNKYYLCWDKNGHNLKREVSTYLNPLFYFYKGIRVFNMSKKLLYKIKCNYSQINLFLFFINFYFICVGYQYLLSNLVILSDSNDF